MYLLHKHTERIACARARVRVHVHELGKGGHLSTTEGIANVISRKLSDQGHECMVDRI